MTDTELLARVKSSLGITGTYQDETLLSYIEDVKGYLLDAGVNENVLNNAVSVGVIARGVADLWNYGSGEARLSDYFYQRAKQLIYKIIEPPVPILGELTLISEPGKEFFTTKITVIGASKNPMFRYKITPNEIDFPAYHDDVSDYTPWNGVSDIEAEDGHIITIIEVNSDNLAEKAGNTRVIDNLG